LVNWIVGCVPENFDARKFKMRQEKLDCWLRGAGRDAEVDGAGTLHSGSSLAARVGVDGERGCKLLGDWRKESCGMSDRLESVSD